MFGIELVDGNRGDIADKRQDAVHVVFAADASGTENVETQIATLKPIES